MKLKRILIWGGVVVCVATLYVVGNYRVWLIAAPRCEVHGLRLRKDTVAIEYGHWVIDRCKQEARKRFFPHSYIVVEDPRDVLCGIEPKHKRICYCSECRIAETKWNDEKKVLMDYYACKRHRDVLDLGRYWYALDNALTNAPCLAKAKLMPYLVDNAVFICPAGGVYSVDQKTQRITCSLPKHMFDTFQENHSPRGGLQNWAQTYRLDYKNADNWWYSYNSTNKDKILFMPGATIVFKGLNTVGRDMALGARSNNDILTLDMHSLRQTEHWRYLEIDGQRFDLSQGRPRIIFETNGMARVVEELSRQSNNAPEATR